MFAPTSRQRGRREAGRMDRGSAMTLFKELEKKGRELEKQAEHWKAQHAEMAAKNEALVAELEALKRAVLLQTARATVE